MKYDAQFIKNMHSTTSGNDKMSIEYFINVLSKSSNFDTIYDNNLKMGNYAFCDIVGWRDYYPFYFELKCRKNTYSWQYPDAGISPHKYKNLLSNAIMTSGKSYYVAFYLDCWCFWDLLNEKPVRYGTWKHSKTTEFNNNYTIIEEEVPFFSVKNHQHKYVYA